MKTKNQLSELQISILQILWKKGEATAAEVQQALQQDRGLAFTTVSTLLSRLEKRGLVSHRPEGRTYIYHATVEEKDVKRSVVSDVVKRLFRGDASELVSHLLAEDQIDAGDLEKVRALIKKAKRKRGK